MSSTRFAGLSVLRGSPPLAPDKRRQGKSDIALSCHNLRVVAGYLLLCASVGVCHDECGILLSGIISGGSIDVGTDFQTVQVIFNRVDIDLSGFVLHNGVVVDQAIGIALIGKDILYIDILEIGFVSIIVEF